jgi:hypothetical protein
MRQSDVGHKSFSKDTDFSAAAGLAKESAQRPASPAFVGLCEAC